jgi:hypothetical protein
MSTKSEKNSSTIARLKFPIEDLAEEILDQIPQHFFERDDTTFLDPAIGGGQIVAALIKRLRKYGHNDANIATRIYGCENNKMRVEYAVRKNGLIGKYRKNSFVEEDLNMKFDVVIGNPPFQESKKNGARKDQASNLWSKFWSKSFSITKKDGVIAFITPTSWTSPSADLKGKMKVGKINRLWDLFNSYTSYANIKDVAQHFPGVGSSFGYVIVDKNGDSGLVFSDGTDTSLGFLPKSNIDDIKLQLSSADNLDKRCKKINQNNTPGIRVSIPMTRALESNSIEILHGSEVPTKGSSKPNLYLYLHVSNEDDAKHVQSRIVECLDILQTHCRWSGFISIQTVKMIAWNSQK